MAGEPIGLQKQDGPEGNTGLVEQMGSHRPEPTYKGSMLGLVVYNKLGQLGLKPDMRLEAYL
ncbi:hypothetical protein Tco_1088534, partial [Tanacetum coccineum]